MLSLLFQVLEHAGLPGQHLDLHSGGCSDLTESFPPGLRNGLDVRGPHVYRHHGHQVHTLCIQVRKSYPVQLVTIKSTLWE